MQELRRLRLQTVLKEELAQLLMREVRDPRVVRVTLTEVRLTEDAMAAVVKVLPWGGASEEEFRQALKGLASASGYLRQCLKKSLSLKVIPQLRFEEDVGLSNTLRVEELLKKI